MAEALLLDAPEEALPKRKAKAETLAEKHDQFMIEFDAIIASAGEERALALEDRRFAFIAGAQWEGDWQDQWANSIMVEINKTAAGLEKIDNDYRANRVTVDFRPVGSKSSEQTADLLDGLYRADFYESNGQQVVDLAWTEGSSGGMGAWRLTNRYADEYDPDSDEQRIAFEQIPDADQSVFFDLNAKSYDKSDARRCYVISALATSALCEEYDTDITSWPDARKRWTYDWFQPDVVRIAEVYEVEEKSETLRIFDNTLTNEEQRFFVSDLEDEDAQELLDTGWVESTPRKVKRRRVHKYIVSGAEILRDCGYIAGDQIPVVPFYGKRWFIDGIERFRGHVRLAKDPQRIYNTQISKLVETSSLSPFERPVFYPEEIANHEEAWAKSNINRSPYLLRNAVIGQDGNPVPLPIQKLEPPQLQPVDAALIQLTATDINTLTNADDGADQTMSNVSADAMDIAATRTDAKAYSYLDNFAQSMKRCGEVYKSMAREVYVEEGRIVDIVGEDGGEDTAILQEPYTDQTGNFSIRNDLSKGKYKVVTDVTEATATKKDKTVRNSLRLAEIAIQAQDMETAQAAYGTAVLNYDGEGLNDLRDWMRQRLIRLGVVKPSKEEAQQIAHEQENQQPDPQAQALQAQAAALAADAQKSQALTQKAVADTGLSRANTIKALADAHATNAKIGEESIDAAHSRDIATLDAITHLHEATKPEATTPATAG